LGGGVNEVIALLKLFEYRPGNVFVVVSIADTPDKDVVYTSTGALGIA
jgi:hypothetical protein